MYLLKVYKKLKIFKELFELQAMTPRQYRWLVLNQRLSRKEIALKENVSYEFVSSSLRAIEKDLNNWIGFWKWLCLETGDKNFYLNEIPISKPVKRNISFVQPFPPQRISMLTFQDINFHDIPKRDKKIITSFQQLLRDHFNKGID